MVGAALAAGAILRRVGGVFAAVARDPLGRVLLVAVGVLALLWLADARAYRRGANEVRAEWQAEKDAAAKAGRQLAERNAKVTTEVGAKVEKRQAEIRVVTKELIRDVPKYITVQSDARCVVPAGFVSLHDQAAAGVRSPDPAGFAAEAPSDVALSTVGETVAANYGTCNVWREQVIGWQEWWARISAPLTTPAR